MIGHSEDALTRVRNVELIELGKYVESLSSKLAIVDIACSRGTLHHIQSNWSVFHVSTSANSASNTSRATPVWPDTWLVSYSLS